MQPSSQSTHGIFTLYGIDLWQGWDRQSGSQPHALGKQEKQVLVINFPFVWTEEPLTGHRGGKQKALYCWGSSNFSPLKVRNIKSTYNKRSHPTLTSLWFGLNKVWLCEHLWSAGQLDRLTKDGRLCCLAQLGSGVWHRTESRSQQEALHVLWFSLTLLTHQGITLEEAAGLFSYWPYSWSQECTCKYRHKMCSLD